VGRHAHIFDGGEAVSPFDRDGGLLRGQGLGLGPYVTRYAPQERTMIRVLADRVWAGYAWHVPGLPGDVDLDSLRGKAARSRPAGPGGLASPAEGR